MDWIASRRGRAGVAWLLFGVICAACGRPPLSDASTSGGFGDTGSSGADDITAGITTSNPTASATATSTATVTTSVEESDTWAESPEGPEWGATDSADWSAVETGTFETETGPDTDGGDGDCCEVHGGLGCEDPEIAACVCQSDPYCCETFWDSVCVEEVESLGCGSCGGSTVTTDGTTSSDTTTSGTTTGDETTTGGGLPDGEPCVDNEMCEGGWCWAEDFSPNMVCQSSCIEPDAPINHICDDDDDCCEGWCNLIEPFGVGECVA